MPRVYPKFRTPNLLCYVHSDWLGLKLFEFAVYAYLLYFGYYKVQRFTRKSRKHKEALFFYQSDTV